MNRYSFYFLFSTPGGTSSLVGYLSYFLQLIDASLKDIVARISAMSFLSSVSVDVNQETLFSISTMHEDGGKHV